MGEERLEELLLAILYNWLSADAAAGLLRGKGHDVTARQASGRLRALHSRGLVKRRERGEWLGGNRWAPEYKAQS